MWSCTRTVQAGGGSPGGDAQLGGLCLLLWAQRECVCVAMWQGHASATTCPCHGSCMGPLYIPPQCSGAGSPLCRDP